MPFPSPIRRGRLAAIALVLLVVAACGSTEPSPSSAASDDGASTRPSLGLTSNLAEFEGELRDATTREGALIRDLTTASVGTGADLRRVTTAMRDWADLESDWLREHPPEPCYDAATTKFQAALEAMTTAADRFEATTTASPAQSDDAAFAPAMESLQSASRALADAAASAKANRPNCR